MHALFFRIFFSLIISFLMTLYLVPVFSLIAKKLKIMDVPDGSIKLHKKPIPYLGGVAVYVGFLTTLALVFPFESQTTLFLIGVTLLLFIGLIDDLLRIKPYQKFFGQLVVAFCFLKSGFYLKESFFLHSFWNIPISLLWLLTVINAFNLVDVMDGLATTIAITSSVIFLIFALLLNKVQAALLLGPFIGALCGFLWYNKPPARIYLGDAGSLFIGGFLAAIPFLYSWSALNSYGLIAPVLVLFIPLFEVGLLVGLRTWQKIPFYHASPDHFSLYLQRAGWTKQNVLTLVLFVSLALAVLSIAHVFNVSTKTFNFTGILLFFLILIFSIRKTIFNIKCT